MQLATRSCQSLPGPVRSRPVLCWRRALGASLLLASCGQILEHLITLFVMIMIIPSIVFCYIYESSVYITDIHTNTVLFLDGYVFLMVGFWTLLISDRSHDCKSLALRVSLRPRWHAGRTRGVLAPPFRWARKVRGKRCAKRQGPGRTCNSKTLQSIRF